MAGLAVGNYAAQAITLITGPLLARALGPTGRGTLAAVSVWDEASTRLFNVGIPEAIGYYAKEGLETPGALLGSARRFGVIMFPLSLATATLVWAYALNDLPDGPRAVAFVLIAMSPLVGTWGMACRALLASRRDLRGLTRLTVIMNSVNLVVLGSAAALGALTVTVAAASYALGRLSTYLYAWRRASVRVEGRAPFRPLLSFGLRAVPGGLSDLANNRLDQLLIAPFLGLHALGLYAVAVGVNFIPIQLGLAMATGAFGSVRKDDPRGRDGNAAAILRRTWLVAVLAALAVAVTIPFALPLVYGRRFQPSVLPALILCPGTVFYTVNLVARQISIALGAPEHSSKGQVVALVATGVGLPIVLPRYGIAGAAAVSSFAYFLRLAVTLFLLRWREGLRGISPGWSDMREVLRILAARARRLFRRTRKA